MKKLLSLLLASTLSLCALAQGPDSVSPATRRYHQYRFTNTEPSYGLAKVKALVRKIKQDGEDNRRLPSGLFNSLSSAEKFTYCMIHAEDMNQNCSAMPWIDGEQHMVFAYPAPAFDQEEAGWSRRQRDFLNSHRGAILRMLKSTMREKHRAGANVKAAILEMNAYELIPDLVAVYNRDHKDQDILTVLQLLMKQGRYQPFLSSTTYEKLYGEKASYQASIEANPANQKLVIQRATAFYRSRMG